MAFTWYRNYGETTSASSSTLRLSIPATTFEAGADLTVRRFIFDWTLDISDTANLYVEYGRAPFGLGVQITTASSGSPPTPGAGPLASLTAPWWWWGQPTYNLEFANDLPAETTYWRGSGRIDSNTNHLIDNSVNTTVWLTMNLFDLDGNFDSCRLGMGSQILTAPQGA